MANEATVTATLDFLKGNVATISRAVSALKITVAGDKYTQIVQEIGFASEEAIDLGDVGTPGFCWMKNLDGTNFVEIRSATGVADMIKMKAGEPALFRMAAAVPFAQADTANVNLEMLLLED